MPKKAKPKSVDKRVQLLDELAKFLGSDLAKKSILLEIESKHGPDSPFATGWGRLRSLVASGWADEIKVRGILRRWFDA